MATGKLKFVVNSRVSGSARESLIGRMMMQVRKLKNCSPVMILADAEASVLFPEEPSSIGEALAMFKQPILFERTIRNLSSPDLEILAGVIEAKFQREINKIEAEFEFSVVIGGEEVKDDDLLMRYGVGPMGVALIKVLVNKFAMPSGNPPWTQPYEEAAIGLGTLFICSAMLLQYKKPGLSNIMAKVGVATIAFAILLPLALALYPPVGLLVGLVTAFFVVGVLALI